MNNLTKYYVKNNDDVQNHYKSLHKKLNNFFNNKANKKKYKEYIELITSINESNKKREDIKPLNLFKEDLLSIKDGYINKDIINLYEILPSDIKALYEKKAHRLTLISYYKLIQYNQINKIIKKLKLNKANNKTVNYIYKFKNNKFVKIKKIKKKIKSKSVNKKKITIKKSIKAKKNKESLDDDSDFNSTPKKQKVKIRKRDRSKIKLTKRKIIHGKYE